MNWFHVLAMFSLWALCMARSSLATSGVGGAGPASPPSAFVRSGSGHSGRSSSNAWPCRSRREQEDLVAVGMEEDAEQNLLRGLEQAPASLLSELPEQVLGQVLEPELVQTAAQ